MQHLKTEDNVRNRPKALISDNDVKIGFLRCECDTKYDKSTFDLLTEYGCRVCNRQFRRMTDAEFKEILIRVFGDVIIDPFSF